MNELSQCKGTVPVATKVDRPMREFIEDEAERLGVTKSEYLRRALELCRYERAGETACEHCGGDVEFPLQRL